MSRALVMSPAARVAMTDVSRKLGRSFRNARVAAGDRQIDTAKRAGVMREVVSNFERGAWGNVMLGNIVRLFELYDLTIVALPKASPLCPAAPEPIVHQRFPRHILGARFNSLNYRCEQ